MNSLLFDHNHSLWIGSETSGLYRLSNGKLDHYDATNGLSGNNIYSVFEDREHDPWVVIARLGNMDIQLDLFLDYASNVNLYPEFQRYFRQFKPPLLAIWGKSDAFFQPAGAEAFSRDDPNARHQLLDAGHFAWRPMPRRLDAKYWSFWQK